MKNKSGSKIGIIILTLILIGAIGFVCYDKFFNTEKLPVPTPIQKDDKTSDNNITKLTRITITDTNQLVTIGNKEYNIKKEVTVDGAFLLINDAIQELWDMETVYADYAYVTNKYIIFTTKEDLETIVYAIDEEGNEIATNDNKYQVHDLKVTDNKVYAKGHVSCELEDSCQEEELIITYENDIITVLKNN